MPTNTTGNIDYVIASMRLNGAWIWLMDGKQRAAKVH